MSRNAWKYFYTRILIFLQIATEEKIRKMKKYEILKVCGEPDFSIIPIIDIDVRHRGVPTEIGANAQICYSDEALFVHLWTAEENIRAEENGPVGMPCYDSCLEFFFCPMENDPRYFNIEFNMNGCVFFGFGTGIPDLFRLLPEERTVKDVFNYKINKTDAGWEIFYSIPHSLIRQFFPEFKAYTGKQMRANCYKCADFSEPPHYLSWSKIEGPNFSFHNPKFFGIMEFM